jgi:hypothetical protein
MKNRVYQCMFYVRLEYICMPLFPLLIITASVFEVLRAPILMTSLVIIYEQYVNIEGEQAS